MEYATPTKVTADAESFRLDVAGITILLLIPVRHCGLCSLWLLWKLSWGHLDISVKNISVGMSLTVRTLLSHILQTRNDRWRHLCTITWTIKRIADLDLVLGARGPVTKPALCLFSSNGCDFPVTIVSSYKDMYL
ncbi:hypothetical protein TNCV_4224041 [Trichonephila clavipes]|nr:hypothetical protein TNCV_4224041 [Trichonephila clavipes]